MDMMKCIFCLTVLLGLPSLAWGQSYDPHITDYQLDAEQAEQLSQNEQAREQQYTQQLQIQAIQEQMGELRFEKAVRDMNDAAKGSTYFPAE